MSSRSAPAGGRARYGGCGCELAKGYDEVIRFTQRMHNESMRMFAKVTDEHLQQKCQSADGSPITTWKLLRSCRSTKFIIAANSMRIWDCLV